MQSCMHANTYVSRQCCQAQEEESLLCLGILGEPLELAAVQGLASSIMLSHLLLRPPHASSPQMVGD